VDNFWRLNSTGHGLAALKQNRLTDKNRLALPDGNIYSHPQTILLLVFPLLLNYLLKKLFCQCKKTKKMKNSQERLS
jgi:hypothetical protein